MDFVVYQVMEFQHIDVTHRYLAVELFAGTAIDQCHLTGTVETGLFQHFDDIGFVGTVEDRRGDGNAAGNIAGHFQQLFVIQGGNFFFEVLRTVNVLQFGCQFFRVARVPGFIQQIPNLLAETGAGPTQMGFQNLADIHTRRHAQRVKHDINRLAVFQVGHILNRNNLRDNTLVAMAAGHLVAGLQFTLHGNKDFDHLHNAGAKVVAALQLVDFVLETGLQLGNAFFEMGFQGFYVLHHLVVGDNDLGALANRVFGQQLFGDLGAFADAFRTADHFLVEQKVLQADMETAFQDGPFVVPVLGQTFDFGPFVGQGAFVFLNAAAGEDTDLKHRSGNPRRQPQ